MSFVKSKIYNHKPENGVFISFKKDTNIKRQWIKLDSVIEDCYSNYQISLIYDQYFTRLHSDIYVDGKLKISFILPKTTILRYLKNYKQKIEFNYSDMNLKMNINTKMILDNTFIILNNIELETNYSSNELYSIDESMEYP